MYRKEKWKQGQAWTQWHEWNELQTLRWFALDEKLEAEEMVIFTYPKCHYPKRGSLFTPWNTPGRSLDKWLQILRKRSQAACTQKIWQQMNQAVYRGTPLRYSTTSPITFTNWSLRPAAQTGLISHWTWRQHKDTNPTFYSLCSGFITSTGPVLGTPIQSWWKPVEMNSTKASNDSSKEEVAVARQLIQNVRLGDAGWKGGVALVPYLWFWREQVHCDKVWCPEKKKLIVS